MHDVLYHGNFRDRTSFSIVNQHMSEGLRHFGYNVTELPFEGPAPCISTLRPPDIYFCNGFPHDAQSAPGRLNVFLFVCEYRTLEAQFAGIVPRLNHYFDALLVPTRFVAKAARASGIRIPIHLCPHGVDSREFHPGVPPAAVDSRKNYRFLNLGGAIDRKGFDVLLQAYTAEFTANDDVTLVVKVRRYELERLWVQRVVERARLQRANAPEVVYLNQDDESIAGYYTACDVGVFPFRGEGFGLPILGCIASGRPVIVTRGTGPLDFCTPTNASFIRARPNISHGRDWLEPDIADLRRAMRHAYEHRAPRGSRALQLRNTVSQFTWNAATAALHSTLQGLLERKPRRAAAPRSTVVYSYAQTGATSWKHCVSHIHQLLGRHYAPYHGYSAKDAPPDVRAALAIGQSEHCLEAFLRAAQANPEVKRILHQEVVSVESRDALANAERHRCGLPPIHKLPIAYWKNALECQLADRIIVASRAAAGHFTHPEIAPKVEVIPWGFDRRHFAPHPTGRTTRFLFAGFDPVRKGIRILFEAWDRLRPRGAELLCYVNEEVLQSPLLLKYLVRNPTITVSPTVPQRRLLQLHRQTDCSILPSLEDSFSLTVADGMSMGRPAIVSTETGIADFIHHQHNGLIVNAGSVRSLIKAIDYCCTNRRRLRELGEAARETARSNPWTVFHRDFLALTDSVLQRGSS